LFAEQEPRAAGEFGPERRGLPLGAPQKPDDISGQALALCGKHEVSNGGSDPLHQSPGIQVLLDRK
jgi:hypothetical protein